MRAAQKWWRQSSLYLLTDPGGWQHSLCVFIDESVSERYPQSVLPSCPSFSHELFVDCRCLLCCTSPTKSMTRQGEKKKKVDDDKLDHLIIDILTFLEAVKAKPSMWMDERLEPLRECHGHVSSHPDLFPPVGPQDDEPAVLAMASSCTSADDSTVESTLTKGTVLRLWDRQPINFPLEKPCVLVRLLSCLPFCQLVFLF